MRLSSYACYYGPNRLADLSIYDLVILQPGHYTAVDTAYLRQKETCPVAYLSLGEEPAAAATAVWTLLDPHTGRPATNPGWQTYYIDCRSPAWQTHTLQERIPEILARGFAGLFLDTLDVQEQHPQTRSGVVGLVQAIRATYPELILIANRGFSILPEVIHKLDAILFEAFTTCYERVLDKPPSYRAWAETEMAWTAQQAMFLQKIQGERPVLALDYAAPEDATLRRLARKRAQAYGFLSYVGPLFLDQLTAA